jgi:hypothetical protein
MLLLTGLKPGVNENGCSTFEAKLVWSMVQSKTG